MCRQYKWFNLSSVSSQSDVREGLKKDVENINVICHYASDPDCVVLAVPEKETPTRRSVKKFADYGSSLKCEYTGETDANGQRLRRCKYGADYNNAGNRYLPNLGFKTNGL